ncbi:hypothetical protein N1028_06025 [Herbiconiux sp. CPCC 203407]|uniref:Uncharacterized protein n=1 Tax=Herbiconiux oxytropis TaxID=2970915 RepID=A0AA42BSM3_9MICO|nr:hypothetical protein [Herbiconiux oxytropis]MCS5724157.1 hypothetical protein [Herbiconiux oxytropis]MCS5725450.1 hypothetical protein [Herbiconiux oxytropis]
MRARRVVAVVAVAAATVGILAGGFFGWGVLAEQRADAAYEVLDARVESLDDARGALEARTRSAQGEADRVRTVVASGAFAADTDPAAAPLREALVSLDLALTAAGTHQADEPAADEPAEDGGARAVEEPPVVIPWQVMDEAAEVEAQAYRANVAANELLTAAETTAGAEEALGEAEVTYFAAVAARGRAEIETNALASRKSQVDLGYLLAQAEDPAQSAAWHGGFLDSVQAGVQTLRDSQGLEEAELADPALETRREIEAYARSLSAGVELDFVWAPEVSGLGEGWLSGTAETYSSDGGWSIISLNYSVEQAWAEGDENARAIVAHEVGHTQFIRESCEPLFTGPVFSSDHEMWATAWSIGLGYDLPGSGIEAYGRPSDEQIATAAGCR